MCKENKIGPTGDFLESKLDRDDEGGLNIGIDTQEDRVVVLFGKPVSWIGFPYEHARQLAHLLNHHADLAEKNAKLKEEKDADT